MRPFFILPPAILVARALASSPPAPHLLPRQNVVPHLATNLSHSHPIATPPHDLLHDHEHPHGHLAPLLEINETLNRIGHIPTPPSYAFHDLESPDVTDKYPYLMGLHATFMSLAFFVALPAGIALRSVKHRLHVLSVIFFNALVWLGVASSAFYAKLTPNMYEGAKHGVHGYAVVVIATALSVADFSAPIVRLARYATAVRFGEQPFDINTFWITVIRGRHVEEGLDAHSYPHEYTGLISEESAEIDSVRETKAADDADVYDLQRGETAQWAENVSSQQTRLDESACRQSVASDRTLFNNSHSRFPIGSEHSDDTLHDIILDSPATANGNSLKPTALKVSTSRPRTLRRVGRVTFDVLERMLVIFGYGLVLTGIVTYAGVCRDSYVNGCLAHLIKGGIFWLYGLLTFARYIGAFSDIGWAWNVAPRARSGTVPLTAEFVESGVIFFYGITNTWMERFGIKPGAPYSTKQVQHISIALMFWFAGIVGMAIESRRVRGWLAAPAAQQYAGLQSSEDGPVKVKAPRSYVGSFNPFPALVIAVTGAAMSAHAQVYLFQVQIHALWGGMLVAFAIFRFLTYFFLWLSPSTSVLPSRPPTEALAGFFLVCGGLMFQFSTEELTLAAMRRGHDDQMMFLNVAVAISCIALCWTLVAVSFNGWLKSRLTSSRFVAELA